MKCAMIEVGFMKKARGLETTAEWRRGHIGEAIIAALLEREGYAVIRSYNYKGKEDEPKAPKLGIGPAGYCLPDLDVSYGGVRFWLEIKTKAPRWYRKEKCWRFGLSLRLYRHYLAVQRLTATPVFIVFWDTAGGRIYWGKLSSLRPQYYFGKAMHEGDFVFFRADSMVFNDLTLDKAA